MSSPRSRVERLRSDLKRIGAPPIGPSSEKLPTKPKRKPALGRGLAALVDAAPDRPASGLQMIPLRQLVDSDLNVRTTDVDTEIDELADTIDAHGLIQNLAAVPLPDGTFGVTVGRRRRRALLRLVERGRMTLEDLIPVRIGEVADGREVSLVENISKVVMNPADEVEGFARIAADHPTEPDPVSYLARRYGLGDRYVAQRLRLAALAPPILAALRDRTISLDAASAYAGVESHKVQLAVFAGEADRVHGLRHDPRNIRATLAQRTYPADCKQARYVSLLAYTAAGGRIERDLWMLPTEPDRLLDPAIVDKLAREKAEAELPRLAKRDGFASGQITLGFTIMPIWPKPPMGFEQGGGTPPDDKVRVAEGWIGLYELAGDTAELGLRSWFKPLPPPAPPSAEQREEQQQRFNAAITGQATTDYRAREARKLLEREVAGRLASQALAEAAANGALFEPLNWPTGDFIPVIEDDAVNDTVLVAVRVKLPRAAWLTALAEADDQTEADNDANDRVAAAALTPETGDSRCSISARYPK